MKFPQFKYSDHSSKQTVLTSILFLGLTSWAIFWFYTHAMFATTEQPLKAQVREQVLYRFDNTLNQINQRTRKLEQHASLLASLWLDNPPEVALSRWQDALGQTLGWSEGLAGGSIHARWNERQVTYSLHGTDGQVQRRTDELPPVWLQQMPDHLLQNSGKDQFWWSPMHAHADTDEQVITLAKPLLTAEGRVVGLLTLDWRVQTLLAQAGDAEATDGSLVWLTDALDRLQTPTYFDERRDYARALVQRAQQQLPRRVFVTDFEHQPLDYPEHPAELFVAPLDNGLSLTLAVPMADLNAPLTNLKADYRSNLITLGLAIALLTLLGLSQLVPALRGLRVSSLDSLTGLPNRSRLLQDLERDSSVSLVLVNLDRFREVNGLFGDDCGDLILKEVTLRMQSFLSSDENRGGRLYRVQGDEFAIALPRRRPEMVQAQLEQILNFIRQTPIHWQNHEIGLSATVSAAVPWHEVPREHSLYIHAREAMREAREKGLHCRVYDGSEPLEQSFEYNQKWAGKLRDALDSEGLVAWFQPILNNTTGRIDKYECLVRMLGDNGEIISPGKFLDVAGKLRLDGHITRVMVDKCMTRFADSPLQFSINLSYTDLQSEELTHFILQRLDETGVGPRVIFELLESASIENYDQVRAFVNEVKKRGCRIAIDDFGTGYSNFEHLLQLQVDIIKIDGSLIRNLDKDANSRRVTRGIVGLARSMKIETVAEFVHSREVQMEVLRLGISFSQGELISMPQPEPTVEVSSELTRLSYSGRSRARTLEQA
ncbi:EAL domain-containing protein [Marinobacterium weihaiense]|uniref:EAL domain-containing protein n=1 Tax=Marinobacterium weihaiense TaxID=2851016 RepID=A0ABS6MBI4_9GAMM|nr:EAL domain-containing protein [Marinobacterium weihaiense]MBV0933644.1 EAL domain-containing protein [Marinobacterium weihaiense]